VAKKKKENIIVHECKKCIYSVSLDKLRCKLKIKDYRLDLTSYSEANTVINCEWYK